MKKRIKKPNNTSTDPAYKYVEAICFPQLVTAKGENERGFTSLIPENQFGSNAISGETRETRANNLYAWDNSQQGSE